ncbi:MAG: hypothetical protein A2X22_14460 [Bacteroidetes bacterium GWF2_49_14]|nr:MAG: hypothetical protein A2X22_14460 [Bacteroidetes bacterium GWF2_49_14]
MKSRYNIAIYILVIFLSLSAGFQQSPCQTNSTVYKIQIASSTRQIPTEQIQRELSVNDLVTVHFLNKRYKYCVGSYASFEEAQKNLANVPVRGAFVVRIPGSAAQELIGDARPKTTEKISTISPNQAIQPATIEEYKTEKVFALQLAASRVFIDPKTFTSKFSLTEEVRYFQKDGWYKYVIGRFATADEAARRMSQLSFPVFVTSYVEKTPVKKAPPKVQETQEKDDTTKASADTVPPEFDTIRPNLPKGDLKELYNLKIKEADNAYNQLQNLNLARKYYREATLLDPDKNYPKDQIIEIDRQLASKQTRPIYKNINTAVFATIGFILVMVIVLIITLILRTRRQKLSRQKQKLREEYQDSITEYLFNEGTGQPENLREADSQRKKQILIDEIMQLYANLSGEISNKLRELYLDLGLDNESVQKTKSPQWHVRAKGFRELAQMNIQTVNDQIELCLNSTNDILRMEAQLAMVRLNFEEPFSFLNKLEQPFTSWEQLHVYEMIQRYQIAVPEFSFWLSSRNETIVVFAIRMIRAFKQDNAFAMLIPFLKHENYEIREETYMTLGDLGNPQALSLLQERFGYESQPGRLQILRAIGKIPDESNVEFLRGVLEPSSELRLEAADALARIESFGVKGIETILKRSDEDLQAVARHILDNKIHR